jgi:hypothetical protein
MDTEILKKPLVRDQIDFKVAQVTQGKDGAVWASILAYKDARVDMQVLDEAVGQMNWQVQYQRDSKGVLQCSIGIWDFDSNKSQWVWKTSNGTESDYEAEKGEYSDAFKRAGFMWGIGRQLYDMPKIFVQLNEQDYYMKDDKPKASPRLAPNSWKWTVSEDYKSITAERKLGGKFVEVFNSNPYNKK